MGAADQRKPVEPLLQPARPGQGAPRIGAAVGSAVPATVAAAFTGAVHDSLVAGYRSSFVVFTGLMLLVRITVAGLLLRVCPRGEITEA
ncbi:hypothetical protein [Streptomyces sp. NBC_01589]|uniref:hypothetical protein n=1 Tax=unclassified Streptomyces TaxID=2593676 RepID=UPI00386D3A1D